MKRCAAIALGILILGAWAGAAGALCLQDQFGNQYDFVIDFEHRYVYGTVTNAQGCQAPTWVLIGSAVPAGGLQLELTAANPLGDADGGGCISEYKLKGTYPDFAWHYDFGYGGQESTYVTCGARPQAPADAGGMRGPAGDR